MDLGGQHLGAATTAGVFEYDLTRAVGWTSVLQQPAPLLVTALLRAGSDLVAGTAGGGLWVRTARRRAVTTSRTVVALILAPSTQELGAYQAHILLQDNELGPGGTVRVTDCKRWAGKRGFRYWFLRALARCPR